MAIKKITIAGGGILGSQIAYQAAYCGYDVTVWLRSDDSVKRAKAKIDNLREVYDKTINIMDTPEGKTKEYWAVGLANRETFNKDECLLKSSRAHFGIKLVTDLAKSVEDADLLIESITEDADAKIGFYKKVADLLPEKTLVVTNSSTFLPSKFAKYTKRPAKFLSLHFANEIWKNNTAEIMAQDKTDNQYFIEIMEFSKTLGMLAIPVSKENPGYVVNSMLIPFLFSAVDLYVKGTSDFKSIDIAWKAATGMPEGPFELIDKVSLTTAYVIAKKYENIPSFLAPYHFKKICALLKQYIDEGKTGRDAGEGFYKYR